MGDLEKSEGRKEKSEEYKKKKPLARLFFLWRVDKKDAVNLFSCKTLFFRISDILQFENCQNGS